MAYSTEEGYYTVGDLGGIPPWHERLLFSPVTTPESGDMVVGRRFRWYLLLLLIPIAGAGYYYHKKRSTSTAGLDFDDIDGDVGCCD